MKKLALTILAVIGAICVIAFLVSCTTQEAAGGNEWPRGKVIAGISNAWVEKHVDQENGVVCYMAIGPAPNYHQGIVALSCLKP